MKHTFSLSVFGLSTLAFTGLAFVRAAPTRKAYVPVKPAHPNAKPAAKIAPLSKAQKDATAPLRAFISNRCLDCHSEDVQKGGLNLEALKFNFADPREFAILTKVHDRVRDDEMPPPKAEQPTAPERVAFKNGLAQQLIAAENVQLAPTGRTVLRRLNRYQYENTVRDLLDAPWLQLKEMLPEDGQMSRFNTVGEALDVSHVQMSRYLQAADYALNQAMAPAAERPAITTKRYYTRDEGSFSGAYDVGPDVRSTFPVLGSGPDQEHRKDPKTVGDGKPGRDEEGVGVVLSTYEPTEIRWGRFKAPVAGRYKLRFMVNTVWVGPKKGKDWWNQDYTDITKGRRNEPITIYSDRNPRLLRRLGSFDATPEATPHEMDVWLLKGETIRPDAARFLRPRPGSMRNPWATPEGQPAVSFRWMEVEGPIYDAYPTAGHDLMFGALPLKTVDKTVQVVPTDATKDAPRLLRGFLQRAYRRPITENDVTRFLPVVQKALAAGYSFSDAMIASYSAVLCSPGFLYFDEAPGPLNDYALASRLSYFLWNSPPDATLLALAKSGELKKPAVLRAQTNRLLNDPRSQRFVEAFLDYWLDLRKINNNDADTLLYPDYQLDDLLVESSVLETQDFFSELLKQNLPIKNIVASNFAMLNERLANLYEVKDEKGGEISGVNLRRVSLPPDSPRGGLMTQASVLKVTANGTTTSPVLRGAWIMERILGEPSPPPPPGIPAVEPDIRGAATIRQQLEKHRSQAMCNSCHSKIDPAGFALESFDVMGGWRANYRALGDGDGKFQKVAGFGHNGDKFTYSTALPVDCTGQLPDGRAFKDVRDLKSLLVQDDAKLARNMVRQLLIYGTGAPPRFADRPKVEAILNRTKANDYGVRDLVQAIVQSELFRNK